MSKLSLPSNWNEVTLTQFLDLKNIEVDSKNLFYNINVLEILSNTNINDKTWEDIYVDDLSTILNKISWLNTLPSNNFKRELNNLKYKELPTITLGEFIDIDRFFADDCFENLNKVCAILYRNYKKDEYDNIILEKYDNINIDSRCLYYNDVIINDIYGIIDDFNKFKTLIYSIYNNIFNPIIDEDDELDDEELNNPEYIRELEKEKLQAQFSWEIILYNLTKGDISKYDSILNLPFVFVLNQLTIKKSFNLS